MLYITEQSQTKLILQDRRLFMTLLGGCFTLMSVSVLVLIIIQGEETFTNQMQRDLVPIRIANLAVFLILGMCMVGLGVFITLNFGRGVTCVFNKDTGEMVLDKTKVFRREKVTHSIYGISHFDIEENTDLRAYGVFMILRSGERIPITSFSVLDREHMESLLNRVRGFLRH